MYGGTVEMRAAIACRQLNQAQAVAGSNKTKRFGIDRHHWAQIEAVRKIIFMESDFHPVAFAAGRS